MLMPLFQNILRGNITGVREVLAQGIAVNTLDPLMGNSPLHLAVQGNNTAIARELINAGAFINLQTPQHGVTPLMVAVWHRQPEMVRLLLSLEGINPEVTSYFGLKAAQFIDFGSAATDAFAKAQQQTIRELFAGYAENKRTALAKLDVLKLLVGRVLSDTKIAQEILALSPDAGQINARWPVDASGNDGHTPLLIAARDRLAETTAALLKLGADQTLGDHYMRAVPLHKAAYQGHAAILSLLAEAPGFEAVKDLQGPNNGYTPLHDAVWHGHGDAAAVLLAGRVNTNIRGYDGRTALDLAQTWHYDHIATLIQNTTH